MEDFNHPDPQNERRTNQEPATQNTQPESQQPIPPVAPVSQPQYQQQPVPPVAPVSQPQYQQPPQQNYQQPQQQTYQSPPQPQPVYQQQYQNQQPQQVHYQQKPTVFPAVKTGEWMLSMFLLGIPLIGFIMLLVWAFSSDTNPSKSSWAKATLIWGIIATVVWVVVYLIIFLVAGISFNNINL